MKNIGKRGLAFLLIFAMLLSLPSLIISVSAADGQTLELYVSSATAMPENTVQITIEIKENPGLASLKFDVDYDKYLTLQNVTFDQAFGAYVLAPTPYKNPQTLSFISPLEEVNVNGTFATLTFRVSDNAPDNYTAKITIDCDEENVFDGDLLPVSVNVHNGAINIIHGIPGDIDGDRKVNNKDAIMLFRYVAGWEVTADEAALDVNCDGSVNNKDAITLFRYVAGWDVEIGRGPAATVCEHRKTEKSPAVLPTCTEDGYSEGEKCADCGKVIHEPVVLPALGHAYENGVCTRCADEDESYNPDVPAEGSQGLAYRSNDDGTCTVIGIGSCTDIDLVIPEYSPEGDRVTDIGAYAFRKNSALQTLTIPDSVTMIQSGAFDGCSGLKTVTIPESVTQFGSYVFADCVNLETVYYNAVKLSEQLGINQLVFSNAGINGDGIKVYIGADVTEIPACLFCPYYWDEIKYSPKMISVEFADGSVCTDIGEYAFAGCDALTTIHIPDSVTYIGEEAFLNCTALTDVYYDGSSFEWGGINFVRGNDALLSATIHFGIIEPDVPAEDSQGLAYRSNDDGTCTVIGIGSCTDIDLVIPEYSPEGDLVVEIESNAFENCNQLKSVQIPDSVLWLGMEVFKRCENLTDVRLSANIDVLNWGTFYHCYSLTNVEIPDGVTSIEHYVFKCCYSLADLELPQSLTDIGHQAFADCSLLTDIKLPEGLKTIDTYAFADCTNLSSIEIPVGIESIGECAFSDCNSLIDVYYGGSRAEWNAIDIGHSNAYLLSATIHFGEETPDIPEDPNQIPMWDDHYNIVTHLSFDQLYLGTGVADQNPDLNIFFTPGHSPYWDRVARVNRAKTDNLTYWGWIAIVGEVGQFGYQINDGAGIYNDEWAYETEDAVYDAALGTGADTASRMKIAISLAELSEGEYTVRTLYRTSDGREVCLTEFELAVTDELPEPDDSGIVWGDASHFEICDDNVRFWKDGEFVDGCISEGQNYLASMNRVINVDGFSHISFRGWANPTGVEIDSFGYQIGQFAPVFDSTFGMKESELNEALGGDPDVMRYENIMIPVADLTVGLYQIKLLVKDTNGVIYNMNGAWGGTFSIQKAEENADQPAYVYHTIPLGQRGNGGPFSWRDMRFGQRYDIGDGVLKSVSIIDMANYEDGNVNTWVFKVWQWNGDYDSTTSVMPAYVVYGENHRNNTTFSVEIPSDLGITGDVYYELEYLSGSKFFTGWDAAAFVAPGVETYLSGHLAEGTYVSNLIVGFPFESSPEFPGVPELPEEPVIPELPEDPVRPEPPATGNYNVPMEYWSVSGHKTGITSWDDPTHGGMVSAGYVDNGALLHQGAIGVGEIDLSKYSQVIIYCGCDNSSITEDRYWANEHNRIILSKVDTHMTDSPAEEDIIASVTYTLHGWVPKSVVIDLTDIDYNGPVYVTYDTLEGTFMLFSKIVFVTEELNEGADIDWTTYRSAADYEEPEEGEDPFYTPAPGYEYTDEGFHMISADYTGCTPFGTIQTKEPVSLQNGFYMELRVDDFAYGGESGYSDHWISFHIWDSRKITPGSPDYGQGWLSICRLNNNTINVQSFISNDTTGIISQGVTYITPDIEASGKEIYTFEIGYNGSEYIVYICGIPVAGTAKITNHLNTLDPNGEFYVGVTLFSAVVGSEIEATILKCGTSAMDATTPTGTDSKAPEDNILMLE